ncbi:MAG: iron-sulfur cluster assembly scaffold protein [Chloroflexi bacterium]|jgi:nitrogen fixation NifU-like protein|nr:iron-sulfur cluster assembly scaffold protein [Chloroflexota bacterium]
MYSETVIEHFSNPRNVGTIEDPDGYGRVGSPVCGDLMEIYIKVKDGILDDIKYRTFGCGAAIASSSIASEMVKGQPLSVAAELTDEQVATALGGLPEAKMHCSNLAASALHAALEDYYTKHPEARPQDANGNGQTG